MSKGKQRPFCIDRMSTGDVQDALLLCRDAGWNQLREDWLRLIDYEPNGCFKATCDGRMVGTVTTTRYGGELGWIGMMLVHPDFRRRGIASALMQQSIEYLNGHQVQCIKLDATPAGQSVYQLLGFQVEWTFHRWRREGNGTPLASDNAWPSMRSEAAERFPDSLLELDRDAFGANRRRYLEFLCRDSSVQLCDDGFGMLRPGHLAAYMGPISAKSATAAEKVVADLLGQTNRDLFWDIPGGNTVATRMAQTLGFTPIRDLTRMWLGSTRSLADLRLQYALADPGTG